MVYSGEVMMEEYTMFMGTTYNSIDEKNRMIVPSKLRLELGERCILTCGLDKCLYIYSISNWETQIEKAKKLPEGNSKVRSFIRHFFSNAVECEFDKQGRIVIPQELKAYADIRKELVTMGAMDKIEVWSKNVWDDPNNNNKMDTSDFANALVEYNF